MFGKTETEVLVAGAGPVGMFTALRLADRGLNVEIVDAESRTAAQSYASVLHPGSLELLARAGLLDEVLAIGRRVDTAAFYQGMTRQAELRFSELPFEFPYLLAVTQSGLENLFERTLRSRRNIAVQWNHRLSRLEKEGERMAAHVDKLEETAQGYSVPTFEWIVKKTIQTRAAFVVGADGHNSFVRQSMDIDFDYAGDPETFAVYEFETGSKSAFAENEVRIVLDEATTNVCWPLPGNRCRWSFQLTSGDVSTDSDSKERTAVVFEQPAYDRVTKDHLHKFIAERAPWFKAEIGEIDWSIAVQFERRIAKQFGKDRCWLVGDAAHQAGPVGAQSMNVGLREAENLSLLFSKILQEHDSMNLLEDYSAQRRSEWQELLGIQHPLRVRATTSPWIRKHSGNILACLPASGKELVPLLDQLGLELAPATCACAA